MPKTIGESAVVTNLADLRVIRETPNNRHFIRISLPAMVRIGGKSYPVEDLSLGGLKLNMAASELPEERPIECELAIPRRGAKLSFILSIAPVAIDSDANRIGFSIADIGDDERHILRQLIISNLNGTEVDGLKLTRDTSASPSNVVAASVPSEHPPRQHLARHTVVGYLIWGIFALLLAGALGLTVFNSLFGVASVSATVSAPGIDIRAPNAGIVRSADVRVGDFVNRDQELLYINDLDLQVELEVARASVDPVEASSASEREQRLALARLKALESRRAGNVVYSPCDCIVHMITGAQGGEWTDAGQRLMVLIPRNPGSILIYSLVPANKIQRLTGQQSVILNFPLTGETMDGTVKTILMQEGRHNRVGVPGWYAQSQGNVAVLVQPGRALSPDTVGQPVEMTTARWMLR